jgi:hypothetical protein
MRSRLSERKHGVWTDNVRGEERYRSKVEKEDLIEEAELLLENIRGKTAGRVSTDDSTWITGELDHESHDFVGRAGAAPAATHKSWLFSSKSSQRDAFSVGAGEQEESESEGTEWLYKLRNAGDSSQEEDGIDSILNRWMNGDSEPQKRNREHHLRQDDDDSVTSSIHGHRQSSDGSEYEPSVYRHEGRQNSESMSRWQALYARDAVRRCVYMHVPVPRHTSGTQCKKGS